MQKKKLIIGIDISKLKLDVCIIQDVINKKHQYLQVSNCKNGLKELIKKIASINKENNELIFCFENTGVYGMLLCTYLQDKNIAYAMVPAIEIKRAKGLTRGKSDKADSLDIANYAITHEHRLKFQTLPDEDLMELRLLLTEREKLLKSISIHDTTKENRNYLSETVLKGLLKLNKQTIKVLKQQLATIEKMIQEVVKRNETIQKQYKLATSVPGIGPQTALYLIVTTRCFKSFDNARQLACYSGVAPFEYSSGSSIRGKTKVNHMANKKLKSLLNMAALSAKKYDKQLKDYYEKKTGEGKNGMLVMNNLRNKLLARVCATIKRETPFVDFLKYSA